MNKIIEGIGLVSLIAFSFFFTEKTALVVRNQDSIMVTIKKDSEEQKLLVDAQIEGDTIIPGLSTSVVDEEKSYYNMKRLGSYNRALLVYKTEKPLNQLSNNYDKYVIRGNANKKMVSFIFKVPSNSKIDMLLDILNSSNIKGSFLVTYDWFVDNNELSINLLKSGHNFIPDTSGSSNNLKNLNNIIKNIGNQKQQYCYVEEKQDAIIDACSKRKYHTILPNIVVLKDPLLTIKKKLVNGSIIALNISSQTIRELPSIIDYLNTKDLEVVPLVTLLQE